MSWLWTWFYRREWLIVFSPLHRPQVRYVSFWFGVPNLKMWEQALSGFSSAREAQHFLDTSTNL